jgi:MFS family permease
MQNPNIDATNKRRSTLILLNVCVGQFIVGLDQRALLVAPVAGWLSDRLGSRPLCTFGSVLIVIGQYFIASLGIDSSIPRIIFPIALTGLGWGPRRD